VFPGSFKDAGRGYLAFVRTTLNIIQDDAL
jgi:hypothetical protein